jgi:hypothetical protein
MSKKKSYNQILIEKGYNFGMRMNMLRVKKANEKRRKQEATMKKGLEFFESGKFAELFKPK